MRGLLRIRLFFAFVPRFPLGGKRRNFQSGHNHLFVQSDAALCVELPHASIGVPVHRVGNLCKTFYYSHHSVVVAQHAAPRLGDIVTDGAVVPSFNLSQRIFGKMGWLDLPILRVSALQHLSMCRFAGDAHPIAVLEARKKRRISMAKMKVALVPKPGADFEIVEREIPSPGAGHVRIRVQACGICHSDSLVKEGYWPGIQYPRAPGHEVAGVIDDVGSGVTGWKKGQRVGVGWHGGQDSTCLPCRRGDFANCRNLKICGISFDGGYQEYMIAPVEALAAMPESLDAVEAGPLLCAGVTTFNALRHSGALPSDLVAVQGIGGLGHLGIQFARKFGYKVAAIGRSSQKAALAKKLGAHVYIDSKATNAAEELQKLGGARVILATATDSKSMSDLVGGLSLNGTLLVVGAGQGPIEASPIQLIVGRRRVQGWPGGIPTDSEDTLRFAEMAGVRPMIEKFPLEKAAEAYARMMSGKAEFRVVLTM
jgi:D-arabinose 1-dehydrogenase-like Zn-dependent alcohol dehydrogenase